MNAKRIPATGCDRIFYCEICKQEEYHEIVPIEYRIGHVVYDRLCEICFEKHRALKSKELTQEELFYTRDTMDNETWNEFIKWSS